MHRLQDLVRLHRMDTEAREVARLLAMGPNTERKYREALAKEGLLDGDPAAIPELETLKAAVQKHYPPQTAPQEQSSIESWLSHVQLKLEAGLGPRAIFDRLRQEHDDFPGTYWAVKRMCRRLAKADGVKATDIAIPVETAPGEIAQVDFGEISKLFDPDGHVLRRAWVFVMVLAHSRHMFAKVVFDQRIETWLQLHVEAFAAFGGTPKVVVPDNLKSAVVRAAFGIHGVAELNRSYRELARHYGFKVDPTPAYAPKKKGKVESSVKYAKHNALAGREAEDIHDVNRALTVWVREIAGSRIHGTTSKRPLEVFEQIERAHLTPIPSKPFEPVIWKRAKVHRDAHVAFDRRLYSVPWRLTGHDVWIRATQTTVAIYADDTRVATHSRSTRGMRSTIDAHLPEQRRDLRHRSRDYWEERAAAIGDEVRTFVSEVFDSDDVLSQLRAVQAIVTHLEKFPRQRAISACERARFYANYSYQGIKRILAQALDLEPLPAALIDDAVQKGSFRFARNVRDLLAAKTENAHEPH